MPAVAQTRGGGHAATLRLVAGLTVSAVFLFFVVRGLRLGDFLAALRQADYWWIVPGVMVYFLAVAARTWRWQFMLRPFAQLPLGHLFRLVCIGYFGNNVYPARAGEVLRSYELRRDHGVSMSSSMATVVIERTFDGLVMLLFVFVALPFVPLESEALARYHGLIIGFTVLFVGALAVFLAMAARPHAARRVYAPLVMRLAPERWAAELVALADRFLVGFDSLSRGRDVFMIFATSVLVWLFETGKYWLVMHAFPSLHVSFLTLMLMNGVVNLATTLPAAPGYAGTFDLPGILVLMAAGVGQDIATAYTLVLHVALWLPITVLGAFYLWRSHMGWRPSKLVEEMEAPSPVGPLPEDARPVGSS
jgi:uncharacterized protein (TIRG00374 family)